jgi:hypothetical protein
MLATEEGQYHPGTGRDAGMAEFLQEYLRAGECLFFPLLTTVRTPLGRAKGRSPLVVGMKSPPGKGCCQPLGCPGRAYTEEIEVACCNGGHPKGLWQLSAFFLVERKGWTEVVTAPFNRVN